MSMVVLQGKSGDDTYSNEEEQDFEDHEEEGEMDPPKCNHASEEHHLDG